MKMNINMKKIVFFLLVQFVTLGAFAQEATIKEAEVAYTKEDYGKAIELYEGLLKTHGESAEIYYNLGNAYYKENKIAPAILNYERLCCWIRETGISVSICSWHVRSL